MSKLGDHRSEFRRDCARLIHSPSFRRLRGKTQLFPYSDSDFVRERLTHSIEVAQVATAIAKNLSDDNASALGEPIDRALVATAALAHDLGHPPFGHIGEEALDHCMKPFGGFEGNAQTLHILARVEKKILTDPENPAKGGFGLNLAFRTLGSTLKYDEVIESVRDERADVKKGYYAADQLLVAQIQDSIRKGRSAPRRFKTLECSIMDISDDIAYSTYDIEDAFKSGFLNPIAMLASPPSIFELVAKRVNTAVKKEYEANPPPDVDQQDAFQILTATLSGIFEKTNDILEPALLAKSSIGVPTSEIVAVLISRVGRNASRLASSGHHRTQFTSELVNRFVTSVRLTPVFESGKRCHAVFWAAKMDVGTFREMEVLKNFVRVSLIESPVFRAFANRGTMIIQEVFNALTAKGDGHKLLPEDFRRAHDAAADEVGRKRIVCDFIGGMTDDYVVEFHKRLRGPDLVSMYRPLQYE